MPFQPGHPKYGGRKPGTPNGDTTNYLSLQLWLKTALQELQTLEKEDLRVTLIVAVVDRLMTKINALPKEPGDSLSNADETLEMLKKLEAPKEEERLA